jgi:hypothetical protein
VPGPVPQSAINLVLQTGMPCHRGHCFAVDPPQSSSAGGSGSSSRQRGESSGSPSQGGTTATKKSSKPKNAKPQDKLSSSSGPLASKPAAAADPFGTYPVSRTLITAPGQPSLAAADRISASNRGEISGGNPLDSILKPPKPVTSGFPAGDSPFPVASKPISFEVASPRGEPLRVTVSGVPSGTGDALAQSIPDPPAPLPPGFRQVVLPDFASLLCSVSPVLVELSPGGSQAGTGPVVSSAAPVSGMPPETHPHPAGCPSGLRPNRYRLRTPPSMGGAPMWARGSVREGHVDLSAKGTWTEEESRLSINILEMKAVILGRDVVQTLSQPLPVTDASLYGWGAHVGTGICPRRHVDRGGVSPSIFWR